MQFNQSKAKQTKLKQTTSFFFLVSCNKVWSSGWNWVIRFYLKIRDNFIFNFLGNIFSNEQKCLKQTNFIECDWRGVPYLFSYWILYESTFVYIYPTLRHGKDVTQNQFLSGVQPFWTGSFHSSWLIALIRLKNSICSTLDIWRSKPFKNSL